MRRPLGRTQPSMTSPTGSGEPGDLAEPVGHGRDPSIGQAQPVDDRGRRPVGLGPGDVGGVGFENRGRGVDDEVGGDAQGVVLGRRRCLGDDAGRGLGASTEFGDGSLGHDTGYPST